MNIPELKAHFRPLNDILYEGYAATIISTAMELGLFDVLTAGAMTARRLALTLGTVETLTEALANVLVALKLLDKHGPIIR